MASKPPFDPNQKFEKVKKPEFNENKSFGILESVPEEAKQEVVFKPGAGMAALESFGNSASQGYLAQAQAAVEPAMFKALNFVTGQKVEPDTYTVARDKNLKRQADQREVNPVAAGIGGLAGTVAGTAALSPILPGVTSTRLLGKLGQAAAAGGLASAIQNPGDVEGVIDPFQLGDRLENAKTGALIGGAAQGVLSGAGRALDMAKKIPKNLENFAGNKTFKATGAIIKDFRKANGQERINEIGKILRERGIVKPGSTFEDIAEAASKLKGEEGKKIGDFIDKLDDFQLRVNFADDVTRPIGANLTPKSSLAEQVEKELINAKSSVPGINQKNETFENLIKEFKGSAEQGLGVKELQTLKQDLKSQINFKRLPDADIPVQEQFYRKLYDKVNKELESKAELLAKASGLKGYVDSKKAYGVSKEIGKISKDRVARENANQMFGLGDKLIGSAGLLGGIAAGDSWEDKAKLGLLGASAALANKGARLYGNPIAASLASKASDILQKNPNLLGEFARPLVAAAQKGGSAFAAAVSKLSTNPKFQESLAIEDMKNMPQNERRPAQSAIERRLSPK